MDLEKCCFENCGKGVAITYLGKPLCDKHWEKLSEKTSDEIKHALNIKTKKE